MAKITDVFYAVKLKDGTLHSGVGRSQQGPIFLSRRGAEKLQERDLNHLRKDIEDYERDDGFIISEEVKHSRRLRAIELRNYYEKLACAEIVTLGLLEKGRIAYGGS